MKDAGITVRVEPIFLRERVQARVSDLEPFANVEVHSHPQVQLMRAEYGVMRVFTESGVWVVPPNWGVLIPSDVAHWIKVGAHHLRMRSTFFDPALLPNVRRCSIVSISPLLREVILRFSECDMQYARDSLAGVLAQLLPLLIEEIDIAPFEIPAARDRRLKRITDRLLDDPSDNRTLEEWSNEIGASTKTMARLFQAETNMNFRIWRQQARLLRAMELLSTGRPLASVAADIGYASASAFSTVFRSVLGITPSDYLAKIRQKQS